MNDLISSLFSRNPLIYLKEIVLNENATVNEYFFLVISLAFFWWVFFEITCRIIQYFIQGKEWVRVAAIKEYHRFSKKGLEDMGAKMSEEEFIDYFASSWPWVISVGFQHLFGSLLATPSLFGLFNLDPKLSSSLACLGILSEMGWEIGDMFMWIYKRYFTVGGKVRVPIALLVVLALHHSLTSLLAIPAIMNYRDSKLLHWLCFDLQASGTILVFAIEYSKILDVTKKNELNQFLAATMFCLVSSIWTRVFHWSYLSSQFIYIWYKDEAWGVLAVGSFAILCFTFFSVFVSIVPTYQRFMKFWKVSSEYHALPADVDPAKRRASAVNLDIAASQVLLSTYDSNLFAFESYMEERGAGHERSNRTQSMPPLRSSLLIGRSSFLVDKRMSFALGDLSKIYAQEMEKSEKTD